MNDGPTTYILGVEMFHSKINVFLSSSLKAYVPMRTKLPVKQGRYILKVNCSRNYQYYSLIYIYIYTLNVTE